MGTVGKAKVRRGVGVEKNAKWEEYGGQREVNKEQREVRSRT